VLDVPTVATIGTGTYRFVWWKIHWDDGGDDGWSVENYMERTTSQNLSVSLTAQPAASGTAPFNVSLTAEVSGTATGTINYTFYRNRSDGGINITYPNSFKIDGINPDGTGGTVINWGIATGYSGGTTFTVYNVCDYSTAGTYTTKVIAERGSAPPAEDRVSITVTSPSPTQFTITASVGANGSISPSGTIVKNAGESQQFTATPSTNYVVDQWYLDGSSVQAGGTIYTLPNIHSDHTVYVTFRYVPPKYTITASAGANGSISPSSTIVKNAGENQQFIATPNTGYTVDTWHLDGSADQTGGTTYTLNNIQSDYSVHVKFKSVPPEYTIISSAGANGSIDPSGEILKNAGESQQFTATPNTNYAVDQWYVDGSSVQTGGTSPYTSVTS